MRRKDFRNHLEGRTLGFLCFAHALVVALLRCLVGIPYCVFFGLASMSNNSAMGPLAARVWSRPGETTLTYGQEVEMHTIVMVFMRRDLAGI